MSITYVCIFTYHWQSCERFMLEGLMNETDICKNGQTTTVFTITSTAKCVKGSDKLINADIRNICIQDSVDNK